MTRPIYESSSYKLKISNRGFNIFVIYDRCVIHESGLSDRIRWKGKAVDYEIEVQLNFIIADANLLLFRKEQAPDFRILTIKMNEPCYVGGFEGKEKEMVFCKRIEDAIRLILKEERTKEKQCQS
jgi:hypothetical protein